MNTLIPSAGRLACALAAAWLIASPAQARVTRIVIDQTVSPAFCKGDVCSSYGEIGRAHV